MKRNISICCIVAVMVLSLAGCGGEKTEKATQNATKKTESAGNQTTESASTSAALEAKEVSDDADSKKEKKSQKDVDYSKGKHHAEIIIKDYGTIKLELDADTAPITVANFAKLVNEGFYDGLTFHRIISGFMIQGGDPQGNGTGGSGKNIKGEFSANGIKNDISHKRGVISMARSQDNDSASSQFFIMHQDGDYLDGQYAAFGKVTEGMEFVDKICADTQVQDTNGTVAKEDQPQIKSIKMVD